MCGICAEIRLDQKPASRSSIESMMEVLVPRGPDSGSHFFNKNLGFGHRRLKIIDLSDRAAQPMLDSQLGLGIVFNGCIYNYQELRTELIQLGYTFFSSGDTEVILKAFHAWPDTFLEKLQGMFAFLIWNQETKEVFAARDRLGIKPLYYSEFTQGIRFASTLPALLKTEGIDTEIDPEALHYYMTFHSVVPAPHTIIKGIKKLPPAHWMRIKSDGSKTIQSYWTLSFDRTKEDESRPFEEWKERLKLSLLKAAKRRMVADVPVGVLLSGGVDSSLVVGLLDHLGQKDLSTYSIGFETVGDEKGDEFEYSDLIVNHFKTKHHKIFIDSREALKNLTTCIERMSEPMVSHDVIGFYLLSREVSKTIKVVQSGQGADEVFAGYHWYPPMIESQNAVEDYSKVFFDRDFSEYQRSVAEKWVSKDFAREFVSSHFNQKGATLPIDQTLRLDSTIMLVDDPVKRVDNMSMSWGLEARVPFLDHELVELAAKIPPQWKVKSGGKYILKEVARDFVPSGVIDRPKGYFPVPALKYLRGPYLKRVQDVLLSKKSKDRGLFQQAYLDKVLQQPEDHITPLRGSKLWQMALLEDWFQCHDL